jgi:3-hydroxybutyryl-CoA dehydrogenase
LTERAHLDTIARIRPILSFEELTAAQLVIETATDDAAAKCELLRKAELATAPEAILASNTAYLPITRLAASTQRPEQFIGLHFMSSLSLLRVVEVVRGLQTSDQTAERARVVAQQLAKVSVSTCDRPGFIVNRLLIPLLYEACFALQEGLGAPEDIDLGAKLGLNHPMGPLELADVLGLDTVLRTGEMLLRELGDQKYRAPTILRNYVAAGWLGCKTGRGFYVYPR